MKVSLPSSFGIGFLGAGQMATALAKGWSAAKLLDAQQSIASDPFPDARNKFQQETGIKTTSNNKEVVQKCRILIIAVKPQSMNTLLEEIRHFLDSDHLIISIAAGISLQQLASGLEANYRLARVMPNTPCLVGASAAGFALGSNATAEDGDLVSRLFNSVGKAFNVPEKQLDAVTGLSGSGPAYVYAFIEALADGGVRVGLPRNVALQLATQTVLGAAKMVQETHQHPAVLKDAVTSPGGTTIAGLHALEQSAFRGAVMDAVFAAAERSSELAAEAK
jgi:pyrroline-5-carboxylate reductase